MINAEIKRFVEARGVATVASGEVTSAGCDGGTVIRMGMRFKATL